MQVVIRMNATTDSVTIDGTPFDRSEMDRRQRGAFNAMVVDTWRKVHAAPAPRVRRRRRKKA